MAQLKMHITFDLNVLSRHVSTQNEWLDELFLKMKRSYLGFSQQLFFYRLNRSIERMISKKNCEKNQVQV